MPPDFRFVLLPPGPPDEAPIHALEEECTDLPGGEWQVEQLGGGSVPSLRYSLRVPPEYERRDMPPLPPEGGALWGGQPNWAWQLRDGVNDQSAVEGLWVWIADRTGFPTVGAPVDGEMSAYSECFVRGEALLIHLARFVVRYGSGARRYFCVMAAEIREGIWMKGLGHGGQPAAAVRIATVFSSLRLADGG